MEISSYDLYAIEEKIDTTNTDLEEIKSQLESLKQEVEQTNEYLSSTSETLTSLDTNVNNTFDILGTIFVFVCIGTITVVLIRTFFTGW